MRQTVSKKFEFMKPILENLLNAAEMILDMSAIGMSKSDYIRRAQGIPRHVFISRRKQAIKRLVKKEWIVQAERQGKTFIHLTKQGRMRALRYLLEKKSQKGKPWNGMWYLIMFDIPESGRRERSKLRRILRILGYKKLQQSVYIGQREPPEEAFDYMKTAKLFPYIRLLKTETVGDDKKIRRLFKESHHHKK